MRKIILSIMLFVLTIYTLIFVGKIHAEKNYLLPYSGHPYAPYSTNDYIKYNVYPITGVWNDNTGTLDVLTRGSAGQQQIIAFSQTNCTKFGLTPLYNSYFHYSNVPNSPSYPWASLQNINYTLSGKQFIGEAVDQDGFVKIPPEAILAYSPVAGEVIDSPSTYVYMDCSSNTTTSTTFHWKYRTVSYNASWGSFSDTWRTSLREYGSTGGNVYNYVWMRNVGLVDFWYGSLNLSDMSVTGYEFYAIEYGINTPTPTSTNTVIPTQTFTPTSSSTVTVIPSSTFTPTSTDTNTPTPSNTPSPSFTPTATETINVPATQTPTASVTPTGNDFQDTGQSENWTQTPECYTVSGGIICFQPFTQTPVFTQIP